MSGAEVVARDDSATWAVSELLQHTEPMLLLDRVVSVTEESLVAEVTPRSGSLFCSGQGVGGWVGIEYMAQAIGAWVGFQKKLHGAPPKMGFLLGCRRYRSEVDSFSVDVTLRVEVRRQFQADNGLAQFECFIYEGERIVAQAELKVFEPLDAEAFLKGDS